MSLRGGLAVFIAATVIAPATASAAVRYTAPTGSGSACSEASPCSLPTGVSGASAGDEVRMTADEYSLTSQLEITVPNLTISGPPGRYTPSQFQAFMIFSGAATTVTNIRVQADGFTLRRVSVVGQSGAQIVINSRNHDNMELDRVRVFDSGSAGTVVGQDAVIENSVIRQDAGTYAAVNITGAILGSTIYSSNQTAIINDDAYHTPPYCSLEILNTIAIGATRNLEVADGGSACTPAVQYAYSWIPAAAGSGGGGIAPSAFITAGEGNLPDNPPALSAPLSGNIALALDSPAINTGCGGSCGIEDFYGRPRPIGAGNDIGATETILPPTLSPLGVGTVDATSAAVSATVNPNGGATTYNFQLRKAGTSDWGSFDGATTGEGTAGETVSGTARPLEPSTAYEVRVLAANSAGETAGGTVTFRTTAGPNPNPSLTVSSLKAKVGKKSAYFTSRAAASAAGSLAQTATTGSGRKTKTWCRTMTTVRRAASYPLKCNLGSKGRRYLKKRSLALTVKTTLRAATGVSVTNTRKLTIKRKR
jgi:hypothetical protein